MVVYILESISLNQLKDLAFFLSNNYMSFPKTILLKGEIGAGKSTFAKQYISSLIKNINFQSPTYTICRNYKSKDIKINHIDFYRVVSNYDCFVEELIEKGDICLIEWPNEQLFQNHTCLKINLDYTEKEDTRDLSITLDESFSLSLYRFLKYGKSFVFKVCK